MKLLFYLSVFCFVSATNIKELKTKSLNDDFQDYLDLLPKDELMDIVVIHLSDPDLVDLITYVLTDQGFKDILLDLENIDELQKMAVFLDEAGLGVYKWINWIHSIIGLEPIPPRPASGRALASGGLKGLIDDIRGALPKDELKKLFNSKLESSQEFRELFEKFGSEEFQSLIYSLYENPQYLNDKSQLYEIGIDIDDLIMLLTDLGGWG